MTFVTTSTNKKINKIIIRYCPVGIHILINILVDHILVNVGLFNI